MNRKLTVIIAENNHLDRRKIELYAHELNLKIVSSVASGEWFIEDCVQFEPDIVILNIGLTGSDGIPVFRKLQEKRINSHFIMLASSQDINFIFEAMSLKCIDFIHKPIEQNQLSKSIKKVRALVKKELLVSISAPAKIIKVISKHKNLYLNERNLIYAEKVKNTHKSVLYLDGEFERTKIETKMSLSEIQAQCSDWIFAPNQSNLINMNYLHQVYASEKYMGRYIIKLHYTEVEIDLSRRNRKKFDDLYRKLCINHEEAEV